MIVLANRPYTKARPMPNPAFSSDWGTTPWPGWRTISTTAATALNISTAYIACRNGSMKKHCGDRAKARNQAFGDRYTATPNSALIPAR